MLKRMKNTFVSDVAVVSCGNHQRASCAECGYDEEWCNGDCVWTGGRCSSRREVVFTRKKWEKVVKDHPNPDTYSQLEESTVSEGKREPSLIKSTFSTVYVYMLCNVIYVLRLTRFSYSFALK